MLPLQCLPLKFEQEAQAVSLEPFRTVWTQIFPRAMESSGNARAAGNLTAFAYLVMCGGNRKIGKMLKKTVAATAHLGMPQSKTGRAGLRHDIWKVVGIAYVRKKFFWAMQVLKKWRLRAKP